MTSDSLFTRVACPCGPYFDSAQTYLHARRLQTSDEDGEEDPSATLDPHDPLSDHKLFPYDQLLFCDECQEIRCPRCYIVEITNWYCPSCLFEVPSSAVKTDGNRCTRNCYNCPLCTSPLSINALNQQVDSSKDQTLPSGPFFLSCPYCQWSSLDAGIELQRATKVTEQLNRLRQSHDSDAAADLADGATDPQNVIPDERPDARFNRLVKFYKSELGELEKAKRDPHGTERSYSSPASLARLMQTYGGINPAGMKKEREKIRPMREALTLEEGLRVAPSSREEPVASEGMRTTFEQRSSHPWNNHVGDSSDLWPVPALLQTKKSKRCRRCRHILLRYDDRKSGSSSSSSSAVTTMKTKIRLLAQDFIPNVTLRPFTPSISATKPFANSAFALTTASHESLCKTARVNLRPGKTAQYIIMVRNPLFDQVRITLATPAVTPGPVASRVTILCPSFDVGADGDMWDSALMDSTMTSSSSGTASRAGRGNRSGTSSGSALAGGPGQFDASTTTAAGGDDNAPAPEAGKVWERGRNWVSVVLEVIPGIPQKSGGDGCEEVDEDDYDAWLASQRRNKSTASSQNSEKRKSDTSMNPFNLEIPILVQAEWDADASAGLDSPSLGLAAARTGNGSGGLSGSAGPEKGKVRREVQFWVVLGAGQVVL